MLVPPVAQGGTVAGDRPVGDTVARAQQTTTGTAAATTTLWPLAPAQPNQVPNQQAQGIPPLAATPAPAHNQGASRYGLYSLFPGGGGGSYVAATPATPGQPTPARAYHATTHKGKFTTTSSHRFVFFSRPRRLVYTLLAAFKPVLRALRKNANNNPALGVMTSKITFCKI